jgi:hypothetical protein
MSCGVWIYVGMYVHALIYDNMGAPPVDDSGDWNNDGRLNLYSTTSDSLFLGIVYTYKL